jgi:hypothetical protein
MSKTSDLRKKDFNVFISNDKIVVVKDGTENVLRYTLDEFEEIDVDTIEMLYDGIYGIQVDQNANDDTPENLKSADYNYRTFIVKLSENDMWCKCGDNAKVWAYFRSKKSGEHGWMCCDCKKIVQLG